MIDIVERARIFATAAHAAVGQVRKYTNEPYIVHPAAVVEIVRSVPHDDEMLAAAWLHDVVEDTKVSFGDIGDEFGSDVMDLVDELTCPPRPVGTNRAEKLKTDLVWLYRASDRAQTIKLADIIENTASVYERDPRFAVTYLREKDAQLSVLVGGNPDLLQRADVQIGNLLGRIV